MYSASITLSCIITNIVRTIVSDYVTLLIAAARNVSIIWRVRINNTSAVFYKSPMVGRARYIVLVPPARRVEIIFKQHFRTREVKRISIPSVTGACGNSKARRCALTEAFVVGRHNVNSVSTVLTRHIASSDDATVYRTVNSLTIN